MENAGSEGNEGHSDATEPRPGRGSGGPTDAELKAIKPPNSGQLEVSDSTVPCMRVGIGVSGAKRFIIRKRIGGGIRNINAGRYSPRFSLADARKKARSIICDIETGGDPTVTLKTPRQRGANALTAREM